MPRKRSSRSSTHSSPSPPAAADGRFEHLGGAGEAIGSLPSYRWTALQNTPGFACRGAWARNSLSPSVSNLLYALNDESRWTVRPGVAKSVKYNPNPPAPDIPDGLPEPEAVHRGQVVYQKQCAVCHGIAGDGNGFLAYGFDVKPRDFRQGWYKFRSTKNGNRPTLEDIERTIRQGVPNSTMPAWGQFLKPAEIHDVARYLVIFSEGFTEDWIAAKQPELLSIAEPPADLALLRDRGAELYKTLDCTACHGERGLGDGPSAAALKDNWGNATTATDLTYKWLFKNGHTPADLYRSIIGGLAGSPMPSAEGALPEMRDRWALISFILSFSPAQRPVLRLADFKRRLPEAVDKKGIVRR
jgi:mono/diheme cytochrome c family protein